MATRTSTSPELVVANQPEDYLAARALFSSASQLGVDLCFQNFSAELERLPEMYGPRAAAWFWRDGRAIRQGASGFEPSQIPRARAK